MISQITKISFISRVTVIVLQILFNFLIPDHDAHVFIYPKRIRTTTVGDRIVEYFFGGFLRWDAQYFMHIALYGYTYENVTAFFPLLPLLVRLISFPLFFTFGAILSDESILLVVFLIFNTFLFVETTRTLFELTDRLFGKKIASISALLFCVNPASIFFSAPYSEGLYCYLTFKSMLYCLKLYAYFVSRGISINLKCVMYVLPLAFGTLARSNGILNIGFLMYVFVSIIVQEIFKAGHWLKKVRQSLLIILNAVPYLLLSFTPFVCYQIYCYRRFCATFHNELDNVVVSYAKEHELILPGSFSLHNQTWCFDKLPLAYSYVQKHYWDVGFLRYYEIKQIPNFLLASPALFLAITCSARYLRNNFPRNLQLLFNLDVTKTKIQKTKSLDDFPSLIVFVVHISFLAILCLFCIHIQVSTRMLFSASPVLYWYVSFFFVKRYPYLEEGKYGKFMLGKDITIKEKCVSLYFLSYFVIGTAMFCNYLPWT